MSLLKSWKGKAIAVASTTFISATSFAADYTGEIGTASTEGQANVTAVILAVIGIAILGFGVNALTSWFKK